MTNKCVLEVNSWEIFFLTFQLSVQCLYLLMKRVLNHAARLGKEQVTQMLCLLFRKFRCLNHS